MQTVVQPYSPMVRLGHSGVLSRTLKLPTESKLKKHPILKHVTNLDGGVNGSHGCTGRLADGAIKIADWSDGSLLLAERNVTPKSGRKFTNVVFNVYYVSSRTGTPSYWNPATDGGLIMLNSLIYAASKSSHRRKQK